jgi:hypothetical protein
MEVRNVSRTPDNDLADAAGQALDGLDHATDLPPGQAALIPACKARFLGMAWDSLDTVPDLNQELRFTVSGTVVAHEQHVDKRTGDVRDLVKVNVTSVKLAD